MGLVKILKEDTKVPLAKDLAAMNAFEVLCLKIKTFSIKKMKNHIFLSTALWVSTVFCKSESVCAEETNIDSNCEGAI